MIGSKIILTANPKGQFLEGTVSGTPKPGTVMEIKYTSAGLTSGRNTWQAWSKATGAYGMVAVLREDYLQGRTADDAYVTLTRCFLYCPVAGEEMNMRVANQSGTAEDANIGDLFAVTQTTGLLIHNSANVFPCFTAIENSPQGADQAGTGSGEYLLACMFNG